MLGEQKTSKMGCPCEGMLEAKSSEGVRSMAALESARRNRIDLAQYFDTVNHDMLINMLRQEIKDERVIAHIRKYLKSGVVEGGIASPSTTGTPQGGNLSPLLSNIDLTKFDQLLESRGHKFVRYADDCIIYVHIVIGGWV